MISLSQYTRFGAKLGENPRPYAVFCPCQTVQMATLNFRSNWNVGIGMKKAIRIDSFILDGLLGNKKMMLAARNFRQPAVS
jgi:hypothetical protein